MPAGVRRALRRGLATDPDARFASMDEFLAALAPPRRGRWSLVVAIGGAAIVTAAVAVAFANRGPGGVGGHQQAVCRGAEERLAGAWDPAVRRLLLASLRSAAKGDPAATERVARAIDRYAAAWIAMRTEACEATRVRGEQSEQLLDRRMQCLDRQREKLAALTSVLARSSGEVEPVSTGPAPS